MSRLLICGFGPFPRAPHNPAGLAVERLRRQGWTPPGGEAAYALAPTVWREAPQIALSALKGSRADAVLLVGVAVDAAGFRVETVARNHATPTLADAAAQLWPGGVVDPEGPPTRPVTAPVQAMLDAIAAEGLPVELSSDAGDYLCNFTLYRVLGATPRVGFLHVPSVGDRFSLDDIVTAIRAAAAAFTANLS
jgi:pyroglutamyl-peptidase